MERNGKKNRKLFLSHTNTDISHIWALNMLHIVFSVQTCYCCKARKKTNERSFSSSMCIVDGLAASRTQEIENEIQNWNHNTNNGMPSIQYRKCVGNFRWYFAKCDAYSQFNTYIYWRTESIKSEWNRIVAIKSAALQFQICSDRDAMIGYFRLN